MSADSSETDRDVFLTDQEISGPTVAKSSRTFQVVLKGGAPWGFTLQGGVGTQSPVQIQQVGIFFFTSEILICSKLNYSNWNYIGKERKGKIEKKINK